MLMQAVRVRAPPAAASDMSIRMEATRVTADKRPLAAVYLMFAQLVHFNCSIITLFIWYISWTPHFVEYKSKTRAKMAESHTTKSKPWPQWGRYSHYRMGPRPCIWLLFFGPLLASILDFDGPLENWNLDFFWIWIWFCHKKNGEQKIARGLITE